MDNKKILILNLVPNTLGDSLIMLPMFKILKTNYPTSFIAATADNMTKELWSDNQEIDEIIEVNELQKIGKPNFNRLKKMLIYLKMIFVLSIKLRRYNFDTCFIAYPNFFLMPLIPWLSGIKNRVGFTYKGAIFSFLLTEKTQSKILFDGYYDRHIVEAFIDLLKAANISFFRDKVVVRKNVSNLTFASVKAKLSKFNIQLTKKKLISIHTLSKSKLKNWPRENFKKLLPILVKKHNSIIFLLGSESEYNYNRAIKGTNMNIYNMCGKLSLREVGALLKMSDLFIGNDSGLAHYASAVGTTAIVLFGSSNPVQCKPIGYGRTEIIFKNKPKNTYGYIRKNDKHIDYEAMKLIKIDDVLEKVEQLLK